MFELSVNIVHMLCLVNLRPDFYNIVLLRGADWSTTQVTLEDILKTIVTTDHPSHKFKPFRAQRNLALVSLQDQEAYMLYIIYYICYILYIIIYYILYIIYVGDPGANLFQADQLLSSTWFFNSSVFCILYKSRPLLQSFFWHFHSQLSLWCKGSCWRGRVKLKNTISGKFFQQLEVCSGFLGQQAVFFLLKFL